jgi:hypothetical protein
MFMDISDILKLSDLHRVDELGHCVSTNDGLLPAALSDCVNGFNVSEYSFGGPESKLEYQNDSN